MKNTSAPSLKPSVINSRKGQQESPAQGHLFLGQKLLAELRILMRLSSGATNGNFSPLKESTGSSY